MLQRFFVFALAAVSLTAAFSIPFSGSSKLADMDLLAKQKKVFDILMYIGKDYQTDAEYYQFGQRYDLFASADYYTEKQAFIEFVDYWKMGYGLKKDALFSYYNEEHRYEMMLLYRLFYFAKDFTTFYKTACWARLYVNPGMFVAAFTTAITYRDDTKFIHLPAIHEIYPNIFFHSKTIHDAHRIMMTRGGKTDFGLLSHIKKPFYDLAQRVETYHLYSNFSDAYYYSPYKTENKMAYFFEDVGLNSYYYYFRMMMPFWINTKEYYQSLPKEVRGDFYFYIHQQLMARYFLERYSNGLGEMKDFNWDHFDMPGFYSDLTYHNGFTMPRRDWWNAVPYYKYKYLETLKTLEYRIMEAIDSGFVIDQSGKKISINVPEGLNILGNIIEGNFDSYNLKYYGSYDALARDIFGTDPSYSFDKNSYIPGALQLYSSCMKDPAFYRIYYKISQFYFRYKYLLNRYSKNELAFPGVKFENVEVDKLYTYFDSKDYYINNAVDVPTMKEGMSFNLKSWQYHLNYKPFTYKFAINSDKSTKGTLRIFLGPAYETENFGDYYSYFSKYYKYFFMLDEFDIDLHEGMNSFERKSIESTLFKKEFSTGDVFYKKIVQAMQGKESFTVYDQAWGFPEHLLLPKGSAEGMKFKLFFFISPYEEGKIYDMPFYGKFKFYGKSFGYPLDRPMYPWFFKLDNIFFKDVYIQNIDDSHMLSEYGTSESMKYSDIMMSGVKDYDMMRMKDWMKTDIPKDDYYNKVQKFDEKKFETTMDSTKDRFFMMHF